MAIEKFPDETAFILELLDAHPDGFSIRQVATMLGINRNSAAKYLDMLHVQGNISMRRFGAAKIYSRAAGSPADNRQPAGFTAALPGLPPAGLEEREYICQFGPDGNLTYVNAAYCTMLQKTRGELIGQNWRPVISESDCRNVRKNLSAINRLHPEYTHEFRVITPGGEFRWQRWTIRGIFNGSGRLEKFQGYGFDITGLKKTEEKLLAKERELENLVARHAEEIRELNRELYDEISLHGKPGFPPEFTHAALENASFLVAGIDRDGRFIYLNKKAREYTGRSLREPRAKTLFDFLPRAIRASWDETWELVRRERSYTTETFLTGGDGIITPVGLVLNYLECGEKPYCCCYITVLSRESRRTGR